MTFQAHVEPAQHVMDGVGGRWDGEAVAEEDTGRCWESQRSTGVSKSWKAFKAEKITGCRKRRGHRSLEVHGEPLPGAVGKRQDGGEASVLGLGVGPAWRAQEGSPVLGDRGPPGRCSPPPVRGQEVEGWVSDGLTPAPTHIIHP